MLNISASVPASRWKSYLKEQVSELSQMSKSVIIIISTIVGGTSNVVNKIPYCLIIALSYFQRKPQIFRLTD